MAYLDDDDPEIYLIPVVYPNGAYVRRCLGISPKNFHVSIGFAEKDTLGALEDVSCRKLCTVL